MLTFPELAARLPVSKSTAYRLAAALVGRGYLAFTPRTGYRLGPKLLELGFLAQSQADLVQVARPWLEALAEQSQDTVHLAILEGDAALYLDKITGHRRIALISRVGDRRPLTSTGLGKALILDHSPAYWRKRLEAESMDHPAPEFSNAWLDRMAKYALAGHAFGLEENEDQIRSVAAPIRDVSGKIIAAISVSSAAQYMDDGRMEALSEDVRSTASAISHELGWTPPAL